jgi:hypothetical protein
VAGGDEADGSGRSRQEDMMNTKRRIREKEWGP